MSMHLGHLHAMERHGGAVWKRYCQLRDQAGLPGSTSAAELNAFCHLWQEHPEELKAACERDETAPVAEPDTEFETELKADDEIAAPAHEYYQTGPEAPVRVHEDQADLNTLAEPDDHTTKH